MNIELVPSTQPFRPSYEATNSLVFSAPVVLYPPQLFLGQAEHASHKTGSMTLDLDYVSYIGGVCRSKQGKQS